METVSVHTPCGGFVLRMSLPAADDADAPAPPALLTALTKATTPPNAAPSPSPPVPSTTTAGNVAYRVFLDDATARAATRHSGCGERSGEELADMMQAALVGSSPALEYAVLHAADAFGAGGDNDTEDGAVDALVLQLTYKAEFTNAVIVLTMLPGNGVPPTATASAIGPAKAAGDGGDGEARDEVQELRAALDERDAELRRARKEKAALERYTMTTLREVQDKIVVLKAELADSVDRRHYARLKDELAAARRDAANAKDEARRAQRESERLRQELRRSGGGGAGSRSGSGSRPRAGTPPPPVAAHSHNRRTGSVRSDVSSAGGSSAGRGSRIGAYTSSAAAIDRLHRGESATRRESPSRAPPSSARGRSATPPHTQPARTRSPGGSSSNGSRTATPRTAMRAWQQHPNPSSGGSPANRAVGNRYNTPPCKPHSSSRHPQDAHRRQHRDYPSQSSLGSYTTTATYSRHNDSAGYYGGSRHPTPPRHRSGSKNRYASPPVAMHDTTSGRKHHGRKM